MAGDADVMPLASDLRVEIGRLVRRLRAEYRFPLSHATVLGRLDREGPMATADLAASERVRPQSMGQTLAELEAQGLVARERDPADGRRMLIDLTAEGRRALAEERRRREGWLAQALVEHFSERERRVLEEAVPLLARLTEL